MGLKRKPVAPICIPGWTKKAAGGGGGVVKGLDKLGLLTGKVGGKESKRGGGMENYMPLKILRIWRTKGLGVFE